MYILEEWVAVKKVDEVTEVILKVSDRSSIVEVIENGRHEEKEKPSTLLKNPKTLESYKTLTKSFGIPSYGEINPHASNVYNVSHILWSYVRGYRSRITSYSINSRTLCKKNVDLGGIGNYIIEGAPLLLVCSVFSIFCGFLYGEFFWFAICGAKWYYNGVGKSFNAF